MKAPQTTSELWARAVAHQRAGRMAEAESLCRKVISRNPVHQQALFALGGMLFQAGRYEEASRFLERLVATDPGEPVYLTNLGAAYRLQGELQLAARAFERILESEPDFPEALHNLGLTLMDAGAPADAVPHLARAAEVRPDDSQFHLSLASGLVALHRFEDAIAHLRHAVALAPNLVTAHHQLANALNDHGDRVAAIASYRRAIELDPSDHYVHSNLILAMLTDPRYDAAALGAEARAWAQRHAEPLRQHQRPHANDRSPERQLRIGYVSADFRAHAVGLFLLPLLEHHDRVAVEFYLYSSVDRPDEMTEQYRALAGDRYREIRHLDDLGVAELVRRDRIDILVDLSLHSAGRRLRAFACKPAPVQMTWLGYAGTTGLDAIDYRITDPFIDPPGTDPSVYPETCLRLPETTWCYAAREVDLAVGPLPARAAGFVTFGSQNTFHKVNPQVLALWARVLNAVPGSRLFLYAEDYARAGQLRTLEAAGLARERVEFGGRLARRAYLERYGRIDIALDTFPFTGATTSLDAIWMGVPVVSLGGGTSLHRAGACIAMNLGMPELLAHSADEFVAKAVELAADLERLGEMRAGLRARLEASPLGDITRFARNLEAAYRAAWRRACAVG